MQNNWFIPLLAAPALVCVAPSYAAQYLTVEQAQKLMFPNADGFAAQAVALDARLKRAIKERSGVTVRNDSQPVWRVQAGGKQLGWFIVDEVIGKHEFITYALALDMSGAILGVEIMDYRETHGHEVRNAKWRAQFKGKRAGEAFELDEDIQNISGATLSCKHIADGAKRLVALYEAALR